MKNLQFIALAAAIAGLTPFTAHAQVLVSFAYPATAPAGSGDPQPVPAPTNATPDASGSTYVGDGLGPTGNSNIPGYLTYDPNQSTTLDLAVSNNTFYSFTITPTAGDQSTLTSFDLSTTALYSSGGSPSTFVLESNVTGFGSDAGEVLASYNSGTTGTDVPLLDPGFVDDTVPVEFRLYVYGGSPFYISLQNGPLDIDGVASSTVGTSVPEPSTWTLLGLGAGFLIFTVRHRRSLRA